MNLTLALAKLTRPLRWRSAAGTARMLMAFSRAERSSFYDMMEAANGSADVARRAQYVSHAVDEARHAQMFSLRALELDPSLATHPELHTADFEHLFTRLGETKFLAFVHLGERRARAQLQLFRDELLALEGTAKADTKTRALLDAVLVDEARHESYSLALVTSQGGSLVQAQWWEARRAWLRAGSVLSQALFTGVMLVVYLLLAPLALIEKLRAKS